MCFTAHKVDCLPQIAEEDIICYKAVYRAKPRKFRWPWQQKADYISEYNKFPYVLGKRYKEIKLIPIPSTYRHVDFDINKGYHSYAIPVWYGKGLDGVIVALECIIPKGSTFYKWKRVYVSSSIILIKEYND